MLSGGVPAGSDDAAVAVAGVVGDPVAHSLSPVLHEAAYAALGLTGWSYGRARVPAGGLAAHVAGLPGHHRGLSVTMPLKEEAAAIGRASAGVAAGVDAVGAANTLVRRDGGWWAANTDVAGVLGALDPHVGATAWERAAVLGSGATARAALTALGERGTREVVLLVRDRARPETLACAERLGLPVRVAPLERTTAELAGVGVAVSTLPTGATVPVDEDAHLPGLVLLDVVYGTIPPAARALAPTGARVVDGVDMLVHQALEQVELMTGRRPAAADLIAALPDRDG